MSTGIGLEIEATHIAFGTFISDRAGYLVDRLDEMCTVATTMSARSSRYASAERLLRLRIFGSLCAFLLIHGIAPAPLDPALFHYIANGGFEALDYSFVNEWHPVFANRVAEMMKMGENGNIDPFNDLTASYLDTEVSRNS